MIIYCPDNFELLNKLRHDLIKVGYRDDKKWNAKLIKEMSKRRITNFDIDTEYEITFYRMGPSVMDKYITLTPSNYSEILQTLTDKINNK